MKLQNHKINWSYLFKHWFGTLLIGPIIFQITTPFSSDTFHLVFSFLEAYPLFILLGLLFSIPNYVLYGFLYFYLARKVINPSYAKAILVLFSGVGVITTTSIMNGSIMPDITLPYSISSIITGLVFKLNFKKN